MYWFVIKEPKKKDGISRGNPFFNDKTLSGIYNDSIGDGRTAEFLSLKSKMMIQQMGQR